MATIDYKQKIKDYMNSSEVDTLYKSMLNNLFPELKESGDERTWIINYLSNRILNSTIIAEKENLKKAIAWLEKQDKSNMGISETTKQELEDNLNKALEKETPESWNEFLEKQGEQNLADISDKLKEEYRKGWDAAMRQLPKEVDSQIWQIANSSAKTWEESFAILCATQKAYDKGKKDALKEQNPAWSQEDEKFVHGLIRGLSAKRDIHGQTTFSSDGIDITKTIDWLKSLKDRVQLKQEWSQEDENEVDILKAYIHSGDWSDSHIDRALGIVDELVQLAQRRYIWKPSDEQMEALVSAIDVMIDNRGAGDKNTILLSGLYHKLKELREKDV